MDWNELFDMLDEVIEANRPINHPATKKYPMLLSQIQADQTIDAEDYGLQTRDFFVNMYIKGLAEEVGEVAGILKRIDRGDYEWHDSVALEGIRGELGDVLWYVAGLATIHGWSFEDIWNANREKLAKRAQRGTIKGGHRDE